MKNQMDTQIISKKIYLFRGFKKCLLIATLIMCGSLISGCEKWLDAGDPPSAIASRFVFKDEAGAQSAISGMYGITLGRGTSMNTIAGVSLLTALQADDLDFNGTTWDQYKNNSLVANEAVVASIWTGCYSTIYNANAVMEGVTDGNFSAAFKNQATGEALFMRALAYFYLVNLYGDVPLVTTTAVQTNQSLARTSVTAVYAQIISDLEQAASLLPTTYPSGSIRMRANKWAATALLARVYLFTENYPKAETAAGQVIAATTMYSLPKDLTTIFLKTSNETIFAFDATFPGYTIVGNLTVPAQDTNPDFIVRSGLLSAFEANDKRKSTWISSSLGINFPYKYRVRSGVAAENDVVLRLSEQYLIRAEAAAYQDKFSLAQDDVNAVRDRAGLGPINFDSRTAALVAIAKERRLEYFAEWGHRWFDLKRTKQVDAVVGALKPSLWQSTDALFPIPSAERTNNVKLTQNLGYE